MVQDGHSLPAALVTAIAFTIVFGLVNGWLIAYAEVPSLFATLATGLFVAGLGQSMLFTIDVVQWSPGMAGFERLGQGTVLGVPVSIIMFADRLRGRRVRCCAARAGAPTSTPSATTRTRRG